MKRALIAPCGMDCSVCSNYLAFLNATPKKRGSIHHCAGCRLRNKPCAFLKGHCDLLRQHKVEFCFQCRRYPCQRLRRLDQRYRRTYGMSPIQNLEEIRVRGIAVFMRAQQRRYGCARCGGKTSVHNQKCFACDKIISWKE
jgi:Protein of unknown function (DUF3795)